MRSDDDNDDFLSTLGSDRPFRIDRQQEQSSFLNYELNNISYFVCVCVWTDLDSFFSSPACVCYCGLGLFCSAAEAGPRDILKMYTPQGALINITNKLASNAPDAPYRLELVAAHHDEGACNTAGVQTFN